MRCRASCLLVVTALLGAACASPKVLAPPRVDLTRYGTLGLIAFSSNRPGDLAERATRQFMAVIQSAQPGIPILEIGDAERALTSVDRSAIDPETVRALGGKHGVDALVVGELSTEQARPRFSINSAIESMRASADIEGVLSVRIFETRSGATVWTNAARGVQSVAHVNLAQGSLPRIGATDPDGAETRLVRSLVATLTDDFKPHWVKP